MSKESELLSFGLLQQTLHSLRASIILMKKETEKHSSTSHKHITPLCISTILSFMAILTNTFTEVTWMDFGGGKGRLILPF